MMATALERPSVIEAVHKGHAVGHEQDGIDAVRAALAAGGEVNEQDNSGGILAGLQPRATDRLIRL